MNKRYRDIKDDWLEKLCQQQDKSEIPEEPFTFYREENRKMEKFWQLLETSTIFQGCITFCFVVTTCYLWATGQDVPSQLWTADLIVIGFFFGSKSSQATEQIRKIRKG